MKRLVIGLDPFWGETVPEWRLRTEVSCPIDALAGCLERRVDQRRDGFPAAARTR